ncbi:putative damage-inducible protein DinB [Bacillus pakistanensis]|uniref:Damage-inducible protein DinB n=1 Tax=Rossellomorea pakistanensis TaxID=992288 RepID=A0ABS2NBC1_9BACI|nr:DinB family protein [Bacillus pakistanensis]MBM7585141.1 putative damage-inducible protein DinB [Bacillus pakistanensis]
MKEGMLFQQMEFIRARTIAALDATTEEMADVIPNGFRNSIRWNLGHIYLAQENLLHHFIKEEPILPKHFLELFHFNTDPTIWEHSPPSLTELKGLLEEQPNRVKEKFTGRLDEVGKEPFRLTEKVQFTTLGEVLSFTNWHEGLHQGAITTIKRAQGIENLWEIPAKHNL